MHLHSLQVTKGERGFFFKIGSWSGGGSAGCFSEFEVRQKYHTSVVLEDLSLLFRLAGRDEYEVEGSWVDADGVCDDSVGGCTVIMGS
jgi:hypothetical protein